MGRHGEQSPLIKDVLKSIKISALYHGLFNSLLGHGHGYDEPQNHQGIMKKYTIKLAIRIHPLQFIVGDASRPNMWAQPKLECYRFFFVSEACHILIKRHVH